METIEEFANLCNETAHASFTISKLRTGLWSVRFVNQWRAFESVHLDKAIEQARQWLIEHRQPAVVPAQRYQLFTK